MYLSFRLLFECDDVGLCIFYREASLKSIQSTFESQHQRMSYVPHTQRAISSTAGVSRPPHERHKPGIAIEMENARDRGSISKTLQSHCYITLGILLYHTNACEALNATFTGKKGYNGKHETRNN